MKFPNYNFSPRVSRQSFCASTLMILQAGQPGDPHGYS